MASLDLSLYTAISITDVLELVIVGTLLGLDVVKKNNFKPYLVIFLVLLSAKVLWQIHDSSLWQNFARTYAELFY